jgi:peptidyl-prolyl cis-trans isomerase B (cyclophilin B)
VSNRGKFERVYEPLPPEPNGTSFSITYAPSEDLDVTNVVVGEVISGFDILAQIGALPTVPDNSDSPFFQVAKSIGDKRALVSEKSFGKPFAKVTLFNCGEEVSTKPNDEEVKNEDQSQ